MTNHLSPDIIEIIRSMPEEYKSARYPSAAYELIKSVAGIEMRHYMLETFPIAEGCPSERRLEWLAASLFILQDQDILPELCRRLNKRDVRSTYFEISAACFCREIGFAVVPSPGLPKRGQDYDFSIHIAPLIEGGQLGLAEKINVEVTELQSQSFDAKRVVSSLNAKRRQLPTNAANMIFCIIPYDWLDAGPECSKMLDDVAKNFFRTSKRVNAIVFMRETWSRPGDTYSVHYIAYASEKVRHPARRLTIALNEYFRLLPKTKSAAIANIGKARRYPRFRMDEFASWVDDILG